MIDFENAQYLKLLPFDTDGAHKMVEPMLVDGEEIFAAFKTVRDQVIFTNKRVIAVNVQGVTGKKKDFTSLAYSKIQAFSVETSAVFDLDTEMTLWFAGLGVVRFQFIGFFDIKSFNKLIGGYIL
jgi:hypothetical protein